MLREKITMFWGFLFPLILCTLFYVSFGNIDHSLECINTAAVVKSDSEEAQAFQEFLQKMDGSEEDLISVEEMTEKEAKKKLQDGKIYGIYYIKAEPELVVTGSGVEESVLQSILKSYQSKLAIIQDITKERPEQLAQFIQEMQEKTTQTSYVQETSLGGKETDGMIQYFFSLIGMTCMFGCFLGFDSVITLQANVSMLGARRCAGATSKTIILLIDFMLISIVNFLEALVLIAYMVVVLNLDLGNEWGKIFLITFLGCIIGISMGILIGSIGKWKENKKIAVMLCASLASSFLSGLMVGGIKGLIEEYCPIVNRLNPASLISDAFYSIAIYQDAGRYTRNLVTMAILSATFLTGSFLIMRRVRYDSI